MLGTLLILASFVAGFVKAPWWFWLVGGITLALLAATDPRRLRASYADVRWLSTLPLLLDDIVVVTRGCIISAGSFATGRALSYLLIV